MKKLTLFLAVFLVATSMANAKVEVKFKLSLNFNNSISSPFDPVHINKSVNTDPTPYSCPNRYDFVSIIRRHFSESKLTSRVGTGLYSFSPYSAELYHVRNEFSFDYPQGEIVPLFGQREVLSFQESFVDLGVGLEARIKKGLWLELALFHSKILTVETVESLDYAHLDTLQEYEPNCWEMAFSRRFSQGETTLKFYNLNTELVLKYELFRGNDRFSIYPLIGVGARTSVRREQGLIKNYTYSVFAAEHYAPKYYQDKPLEDFRVFTAEEKVKQTSYETEWCVILGGEGEFRAGKRMSAFYGFRLYSGPSSVAFSNPSLHGAFPFRVDFNKFIIYAGIRIF